MLLTEVTLAWGAAPPKASVVCRTSNPALSGFRLMSPHAGDQRHRSNRLACVVRGEHLHIAALEALKAASPRLAMTAHHLGAWIYSAGPGADAGPLVIDVAPKAEGALGWAGEGLYGAFYVHEAAMPWRVHVSPNITTLLTPDRVRRWARIVEPS